MKKKNEVIRILDILRELYPQAECALVHRNLYELLIAVTLSAQTTDKSVNKITGKLFDTYPEPADLANAQLKDVESIIKTIGLYKNKSKNIIGIARMLCDNFDSTVPSSYEDLQSLPGVGKKTANVVRSVGFGIPAIAVDTHVFRVSNRIGLVKEKDVKATEESLMKVIPKDRWIETHHSIIFHGREICNARNPKCEFCPLNSYCDYFK